MCLCGIMILTVLLIPNVALGQNLNLTGNLNINDNQIASSTNLLLSMIVSIAEAVIPILVGAFVGHKAINHWQEKKNKIATRNNIFTDYTQSFRRHGTLLDNFVNRVFKSYVVFDKGDKSQLISVNSYTDAENGISGFLRFPSDPNEFPSKKFLFEYKDLALEIDNTSHARDRLYLNLKLYYKDDPRMIEKLKNIKNLLAKSDLVMDKFFQSTNGHDFIKFCDSYCTLSNEIEDKVKSFESELIQLKI